jgi:hypothetical protein
MQTDPTGQAPSSPQRMKASAGKRDSNVHPTTKIVDSAAVTAHARTPDSNGFRIDTTGSLALVGHRVA